jgi:hypothetical protein
MGEWKYRSITAQLQIEAQFLGHPPTALSQIAVKISWQGRKNILSKFQIVSPQNGGT